MKICPCEQCLTKAICRNRRYHDLLELCEPLSDFLYLSIPEPHLAGNIRSEREIQTHRRRVLRFQTVIKSTIWRLGEETPNGFNIVYK